MFRVKESVVTGLFVSSVCGYVGVGGWLGECSDRGTRESTAEWLGVRAAAPRHGRSRRFVVLCSSYTYAHCAPCTYTDAHYRRTNMFSTHTHAFGTRAYIAF